MTTASPLAAPSRPPTSAPPLVLVGASTRAAAWSAVRAGRRPLCADLFADTDLLEVAEAIAVTDYPHGLVDAVGALLCEESSTKCPRVYTGALENHLDVLSGLAETGPLWGNQAEVLGRVRDPAWVASVCRCHNLPCPEIRTACETPARGTGFMVRRRDSAGGSGVRPWDSSAATPGRDVVFQQHVDGQPAAALCLADGSSARVLGVTRQLVGENWLHAAGFAWCGSIGPLSLSAALEDAVARLADVLASEAGLIGLFGIDLVLDDDRAWPIEINPRYTGSAEVIEMASGRSVIGLQLEAFGEPGVAPFGDMEPVGAPIYGKVVLFAPADVEIVSLPCGDSNWRLADIPHAGSWIAAGRPLCSVLTAGGSVGDCLDTAGQASELVYSELGCGGLRWAAVS